MSKRATAVAETRRAILESAEASLSSPGFGKVTLDDVASAAGVSRGTLYHQFGSRTGLIEALLDSVESRADFEGLLSSAQYEDPREALITTAVRLVRFVDATQPLFDNLRALARLDTELGVLVQRKDETRRRLFSEIARRAEREGILAVALPRAVAILASLTCYESVRELLDAAGTLDTAEANLRWQVEQLLGKRAPDGS